MEAEPPNPGGNGGDPPAKGNAAGGPRRAGQNTMDVFGGTEGQAVIVIAVLLYVIQNLTTWVSSNCTC
jgi:hypothetical protein